MYSSKFVPVEMFTFILLWGSALILIAYLITTLVSNSATAVLLATTVYLFFGNELLDRLIRKMKYE